MKGILKWPLIIATVVVVLRIILEQIGAPLAVTNLFSVVMLSLVIFPVYFAVKIANSGIARPYRSLIKTIGLYAILARCIVIPTYWLAYIYEWTAPRFSTSAGGVVGPGVTPLAGFVVIPFVALLAWVIGSLVIGGAIGSIIITLKRKSSSAPARAQSAGHP